MTEKAIQLVLLDLGGVLLQLRDPLDTFGIDMSHQAFLEMWLLSPAIRDFESGNLQTDQFATAIVSEFDLPYSSKEFSHRFESWPDTLFPGVPKLLEAIGKKHQLALLSNTNPVHWERDDIAGRLTPFMDAIFLSYKTGFMKPDMHAYEDVLRHFGCDAACVLFLDDNPLNIDAARRCGMQALLTNGYAGLEQNLQSASVTG